MNRKSGWAVLYGVLLVALMLALQSYWLASRQTETVLYNQFEQALSEGRIQEVIVTDQGLIGRLKVPEGPKTQLATVRVEPDLAAWLQGFKVPYSRVVESGFWREALSWVLPSLVFFGLWWWVIRRVV